MLVLNLDKRAQKFINKLPPKQFGQLERKITELQEVPFPPDTKKIKGMEWYRVDAGEYRVIFSVRDGVLNVPLVGKRNDDEVYKRLKRLGG